MRWERQARADCDRAPRAASLALARRMAAHGALFSRSASALPGMCWDDDAAALGMGWAPALIFSQAVHFNFKALWISQAGFPASFKVLARFLLLGCPAALCK